MNRYTIYVEFPSGDIEELDIDAADEPSARADALRRLADDYDAGGRIVRVIMRLPGELYL